MMAKPLTKKCYQVKEASEIPAIFMEAFKIATEGRPGPVLIDIPMDVQRGNIDSDPVRDAKNTNKNTQLFGWEKELNNLSEKND